MASTSGLKEKVKKFVEYASQKDLKLIYNLFELNKQDDWWNEISKDHQKQIKKSINDADKGKTISHREMAKNYSKLLKK